ncbi:MAG TPA: virginiamycin B lyase [Chloroflexota bacterium]
MRLPLVRRDQGRLLPALLVLGALAFPMSAHARGTRAQPLTPFGIAAGPDGKIWFTEGEGNRVCRMTLSGKVTTFTLPPYPYSAGAALHNVGLIVSGPRKGAGRGMLWFTDNQSGAIGRITTTGKVLEFAVRSGADSLNGLAAGPDGNLWLSDTKANAIKMIKPDGTDPRPSDFNVTSPVGITAGPDGNMWYVAPGDNAIGRISPVAGSQLQYPLPTSGSTPAFIASGADGNLWFTEASTDHIGRITLKGTVTEFAL